MKPIIEILKACLANEDCPGCEFEDTKECDLLPGGDTNKRVLLAQLGTPLTAQATELVRVYTTCGNNCGFCDESPETCIAKGTNAAQRAKLLGFLKPKEPTRKEFIKTLEDCLEMNGVPENALIPTSWEDRKLLLRILQND